MKKYIVVASSFLALPIVVFAQVGKGVTILEDVADSIGTLINTLTPIVVALALLYFFWGLAQYILKADDPEAKEKGKHIMVRGIIALFVMVSIWGIIRVLQTTFGVEDNTSPLDVPTVDIDF
jgi:hypothetical protein